MGPQTILRLIKDMIMNRILAFLVLLATAPFSHAYIVSYILEGTVTKWAGSGVSLPDRSNDLMIGYLAFDTEDFLYPGECHNCKLSYSITVGGGTWNSHAVSEGRPADAHLTSPEPTHLAMQDEGPISLLALPDLVYFDLFFTNPLLAGQPPSADEFVSGTWILTNFLTGGAPNNGGMRGTIDKVTMRASVPEPSSLALVSLGFAGLLLRRRFSK